MRGGEGTSGATSALDETLAVFQPSRTSGGSAFFLSSIRTLSQRSRHVVVSVASRIMSQQESAMLAMGMAGGDEQRLAAERYRLVIENMGSMIFDHDFVRDSTFRSDSVAELFRWDAVEPTAEWWIARIHADD